MQIMISEKYYENLHSVYLTIFITQNEKQNASVKALIATSTSFIIKQETEDKELEKINSKFAEISTRRNFRFYLYYHTI